jgi:hypothetical protein
MLTPIVLLLVVTLLVGVAIGYGLRAYISRRRRLAASQGFGYEQL